MRCSLMSKTASNMMLSVPWLVAVRASPPVQVGPTRALMTCLAPMFGGGAGSGGFAGGTAGADINIDDLMKMFGGYSSPTRVATDAPGLSTSASHAPSAARTWLPTPR